MPYHRPDATFEERVAAGLATVRVLVILLGVGLVLATGLAAYGFARADSATSDARAAAGRARAVASAVNEERIQTLRSFCKSQNDRNTTTIAQLHGEVTQAAARGPGLLTHLFRLVGIRVGPRGRRTLGRWQAQQSQANYRSSVALINDLAPHQNCALVVRRGTVR